MTTQIEKNDVTNSILTQLAKGLTMSSKGEQSARKGAALASVAVVQLLAARSGEGNEDEYSQLVRHIQGVHVNAKEQPETFAASWAFWKDQFIDIKGEQPTLSHPENDEEIDLSDKRADKAYANTAIRTLRNACAVAFCFHVARPDWDNVKSPKSGDVITLNQDNALRLFGVKKAKMIEKALLGVIVDTHGQFNFKALVSQGNERLVANGTKKAPRKADEKITPVRDAIASVQKAIEDADLKALKTDKLPMLSLLVTLLDRINDVDAGEQYIPTSVTNTLRDMAEVKLTKAAEAEAAKVKVAA